MTSGNGSTPAAANGAAPAELLSRARSAWVLAVLCAGVGLVIAAVTSLYTAGPDIARGLGASQTELTWIIDAYTLVMAGLLLPAGALGDRYGHRRILIAGLVLFTGIAIALCFAQSPTAVIVLRVLLGVGAALILPSTLSIITSSFPPDFRDTAVGIWTAAFTLAGGIGVLLTGLLLEFFSWHCAFWGVAGGAVIVLAASLTVPASREPDPPPIDVPGSAAAIVAITAVVYGLIQAGLDGWGSPRIVGAFALGLAATAVFVVIQLRLSRPLLDVRLFKIRPFGVSAFTVTACFAAVYGMFFLGMQFEQFVLGYSPLKASGPIAGMAVPVIPISLVAARLTERFGLRVVISAGCLLEASAYAMMLASGTGSSYAFMFAMFFVVGAGVGLNMAPCTTAIINNVSDDKQGVAASVNHTTREVGTALGVALFGGLLAASYPDHIAAATQGLPEPAREASHASIAGALEVADQSDGSSGAALADAAREAFVAATHYTSAVAVALMVGVAVIAALWAPRKSRAVSSASSGAEDEVAPVQVNGFAVNGDAVNGDQRALGPLGQAADLALLGAVVGVRTAIWTGTTTVRVGSNVMRVAARQALAIAADEEEKA